MEGGTTKDHKEDFWGDVYVHFLDFDDGFMGVYNLIYIICVYIYIYVLKIYQIVYFKYVQFILCQLYLKTKFL